MFTFQGEAEGELYIDDGYSLDYKDGKYIKSKISMSGANIQKWWASTLLESLICSFSFLWMLFWMNSLLVISGVRVFPKENAGIYPSSFNVR